MSLYIPKNLRRLIAKRANYACEYCLLPEPKHTYKHEAEHIIPRQHGGKTISENLAFSCWRCNRNKGPNIASIDTETNTIVPFFNPRTQVWSEHFRIKDGVIIPLTSEGRVTAWIFRFNDPERVEERREQIEAGLIK
jgi:hypothetical protein